MAESGHRDKGHILREVYEENKRIRDRTQRPRLVTGRPYVTGIGGLAALALVVILALNLISGDTPASSASTLAGTSANAGRTVPTVTQAPLPDDGVVPQIEDFENIGNNGVPLADLFDLQVRTIVIDAGHGGRDPGASGSAGLMEKEITLDVAKRLKRRLEEENGYRVHMTRDSDSTLSLRERVNFSNGIGADLFVSIHVNYFPSEPVYALETYYFGAETDASSLRLAEVENQYSEYAVAEFNDMIRRIGDRVKLQESRRLARYVQRSLFRNSRLLNDEVANWGVKTAPFVVLVGAEAPGILSEIGVISNREEEERLNTPEYREQLAMFLEEGIVNYLGELSHLEASNDGATDNATEEKTAN